jgi:PAS domain S-box-containing protein
MQKKKLIILYLILSIIWIYGTNYLVHHFVPSQMRYVIERLKEIFYVLVSGGFFYVLLKKSEELNSSKEEENRLSTLINSMIDFVCFKDGEGRWIKANDFGLKLFQLENADYQGKTDSELAEFTEFYCDALKHCEKSDEATWKNRKITRIEEIVPLPDGSVKTFDVIKVPLFQDDGSKQGLVIIGRDITALRHAEDQLRRTEKLSVVGELSASVAHEIRNPLTSLKGFVQLLQKEDDHHSFYYQIMLDELNRINQIVGELLLLAKPEVLEFTKADLEIILLDVISLLNIEANLYNLRLEYHFEEAENTIECEPNQLKQLFINVIKNAIEASSAGSTISISMEKSKNGHVNITVKDQGHGISPERLEKIGEPFYSSKEKGTGLGLTVSFKIVQSHNGIIHFKSQKGIGTTVFIKLPLSHSPLVQH